MLHINSLSKRIQLQYYVDRYSIVPVSYTHLDVYKRQAPDYCLCVPFITMPDIRFVPISQNNITLSFSFPLKY